ncbi:hypothetical protein [Nocardiopsis deserti]|uniref:hypothetical protein n=1 Tax=Nocardiopsis deserti TaxID=2605988 RepID=UPI00123C56E9|nr:hypothetical protein [Nocardiopsis deserti]
MSIPGDAALFIYNDDEKKLYYSLRPNSAGDRGFITDCRSLGDAVAVLRQHGFGVNASDFGLGGLNPSDPEELMSPNHR